jgi:hypothetical protein
MADWAGDAIGVHTDRPERIPPMQQITLNVICRLVFGVDDSPRTSELRSALMKSLEARLAPLHRGFSGHARDARGATDDHA